MLTLLPFVATACNSLPAGAVSSLAGKSDVVATPAPVVLIRGWRDLWSDGIDQLGEELRAAGVESAVFKHSQAAEVGDALLAAAKAKASAGPVVLIGFSYGADDVIELSRRLDAIGKPVELLIVIDPVQPAQVPRNVRRCVNYYQSNGVWDAFPWLRGVPVTPAAGGNANRVANLNVRDHPDLFEPGTGHKTMAGNAKIHAAILAEVRAIRGGR